MWKRPGGRYRQPHHPEAGSAPDRMVKIMELLQPFETKRLLIRKVEERDIEDLLRVNGDGEVTRFLPYETWRSMADGRAWFERMCGLMAQGDTLQLVMVELATGRVIGTCLLFHHDAEKAQAEIGYVMARDRWQQAKQNWIDCHPRVSRIAGDPASDPARCEAGTFGGYTGSLQTIPMPPRLQVTGQ